MHIRPKIKHKLRRNTHCPKFSLEHGRICLSCTSSKVLFLFAFFFPQFRRWATQWNRHSHYGRCFSVVRFIYRWAKNSYLRANSWVCWAWNKSHQIISLEHFSRQFFPNYLMASVCAYSKPIFCMIKRLCSPFIFATNDETME